AALAVLEVIEQEGLIQKSLETGNYLMFELNQIKGIENLRGKGLMIGFDIPAKSKELKKKLIEEYKVLVGEAKPDVVRLLPALNINREAVDQFINALKGSLEALGISQEKQKENEAVHLG
ncbi:MAG TPA: aminotransferase class III-fold pyridoxal phosphate-dependent enzyme, partial [Chitinophagaceae bacterium]